MRLVRTPRGLLAAVMVWAGLSSVAAAVTIDVESAPGMPGATVDIVVQMSVGPNEQVVGMQNEICFDPSVLTFGACKINPDIGPGSDVDKQLGTNLIGACVRNILVHMQNVNTIPPGFLYECTFRIASNAPSGSSLLQNIKIVVSDAKGNRFPSASGASGSIMVGGGNSGGGAGTGSAQRLEPAMPQVNQPAPVAPMPVPQVGNGPQMPAVPPPAQPAQAGQSGAAGRVEPRLEAAPGERLEAAPAEPHDARLQAAPTAVATSAATATKAKAAATPAASATKSTPAATATTKKTTPSAADATPTAKTDASDKAGK